MLPDDRSNYLCQASRNCEWTREIVHEYRKLVKKEIGARLSREPQSSNLK